MSAGPRRWMLVDGTDSIMLLSLGWSLSLVSYLLRMFTFPPTADLIFRVGDKQNMEHSKNVMGWTDGYLGLHGLFLNTICITKYNLLCVKRFCKSIIITNTIHCSTTCYATCYDVICIISGWQVIWFPWKWFVVCLLFTQRITEIWFHCLWYRNLRLRRLW